MNKDISVIIPIYNLQDVLSRTIDSVLANSFKNYELILVNDGSTDNSLKICEKYQKKESRIKIIDKENGGPSSARNAGLNVTKGKYVCFIDGDDLVTKDYLEKLFNYIEDNNLDWAECARYVVDDKGNKHLNRFYKCNTVYRGEQIKEYVLNHSFHNKAGEIHLHTSSPWASIYSREKINNLRFKEDMDYGEDLIFNYEFVQNINAYGFLNEALYYYMTGNSFITKEFREGFIDEIFLLIDNIEELRIKYNHNISNEEMVHIFKSILALFSWHTFKKDKLGRYKDYEIIKNKVKEREIFKHLKPNICNYLPFKPAIILFNNGNYELLYRLYILKNLFK